MEFVSFPKIEQIGKLFMVITQKIHGSNGQILIARDEHGETVVKAGSRSRWLTVDDDNYGFCRWVEDNKAELISRLGFGRHYGEWCGKGINSGEGLDHKEFILFDRQRFRDKALPENVRVVPLLYAGEFDFDVINFVMEKLKANGSYLVPGFMRPEGIVIRIGKCLYKKVFEPETTMWNQPPEPQPIELPDVTHLLQPIRLEKLLSRDSRLRENYPYTVADIARLYYEDLIAEEQIKDDETIKLIRKALGKQIYSFIRRFIEHDHQHTTN